MQRLFAIKLLLPIHQKHFILPFVFFLVSFVSTKVSGQILSRLDSIKLEEMHITRSKFINNLFHQAVGSLRRSNELAPAQATGKSEDIFMPYQDKIIRHIYINVFNFDRSFNDTGTPVNNLATRIGRRMHATTREFVIRDNLFFRENAPLNAFKLADNERYLRTLEYIQDARIIPSLAGDHPDSVDIYVFTKDFFSIAGGAAGQGLDRINANLYETNLGGMAQRLEVTGLYDRNRDQNWGYGGLYRKGNVFHSFVDASVGYSTMNGNPLTREEETTAFFTLSKRLVSPYSRSAGGVTISRHEANNIYKLPTDIFYKYRYDLVDAWAGYSIAINQLTATNNTIRDRRFLAFRYYKRNFTELPTQIRKNFDPVFNTTEMGLLQLTLYRQDYYKTRYVYGFGTTEDIPYGYNIAIVAGLQRQLYLQRPYAGLSASQFITTSQGDFIKLYLRTGGFLYDKNIQDGSILVGASAFSRIFFWGSTLVRGFANLNYTQLFNRVTYAPLHINNTYGLRGFLSDSAFGTQRLSLQLETEFYLKGQILGFRFAPFPYADLSLITPENKPYSQSSLYTSLGGGLRARNPNLVFETIELRAYFFPGAPNNMRGFKVILLSNLKFRYTSNYITAPDVVQLNGE